MTDWEKEEVTAVDGEPLPPVKDSKAWKELLDLEDSPDSYWVNAQVEWSQADQTTAVLG